MLANQDTRPRNATAMSQPSLPEAERLRQIIQSAIDYAIIGMDLDGLVTSWNEGAHRILGWTEPEMIGQPATRFFTLEDRQKGIPQAEMQAALLHERGSDERWHLRKDGTKFWANGEMMPLKDRSGAAQGFVKILRDRTEQRMAAERHRADAEFLSRILASSGDCIKVLDLDANLIFISEGGLRALEVVDFDTIRGCPWPDFWDGALNMEAHKAVQAAKAGGIGHFQGLGRTMAGTVKYWDVQVTPILDADGNPERLLSVSRDMTDVKRSERQRTELLELSDRLQAVEDLAVMPSIAAEILAREFQAACAGYAIFDHLNETISIQQQWTAPATAGITGLPAATHHLQTLRDGKPAIINTTTPDSPPAIMALPVLEQGALTALFFVYCNTNPVWTAAEIAFARDLVDRTSAALTQRRTAQQIRELAASLERQVEARTRERDRIWRVSRDLLGVATQSGVWTAINPAWTATLGWLEADIIGRTYQWLTHPDDRPPVQTEFALLAADRTTVRIETRLRTVDGTYRWFSWSAVPDEGLLYCVGRDITSDKEQAQALRNTEAQLRQSQKMEAVGQLTGGLAHDFNNLLTGISGSLELLKLRIAQGRLDQAEHYITTAEGAAARAAALTHRLLAFSRNQTLEPRPTQANNLIIDMKDLIQRTVGPEIKVETNLAADLWMTLCDPNQLENAILNLAINARDAMPDGGGLVIQTANVVVGNNAEPDQPINPGSYITVSVTDTGTGMTPEVIAQAFHPFFTTKAYGRGTGLGLSMIDGFAKQSGGQVRITSKLGEGATIRIYLPRYAGEYAESLPIAERSAVIPARAGDTVLVVDDEPTVRMLVTDLLEERGYTVIEAADGNAGLKLISSDLKIDLLIIDVGLPGGVNGRQVAEVGLARRPTLKVLFVTGYAEDSVIGTGQLQPRTAVLAKPFAMDLLASRIRSLITEDS